MFTVQEKNEIASYSLYISMDRWAPTCWRTLNNIVFGKRSKALHFSRLFDALAPLIPCPMCRDHLLKYLIDNPIGKDVAEWLVEFHNTVSKRIGAPLMLLEDVKSATCATLTNDEISASDDLFTFLFALATLYVPSKQREFMKKFLEELVLLFPIDAAVMAMSNATVALESAQTLFFFILTARNSALEAREKYSLFDAVERSAPPPLYETLGINEHSDIARMQILFQNRIENHRIARDGVYDRIKRETVQDSNIFRNEATKNIVRKEVEKNENPDLKDNTKKAEFHPTVGGEKTKRYTSDFTPDSVESSLSAEIFGIVIGGSILVVLTVIIILIYYKRKQKK